VTFILVVIDAHLTGTANATPLTDKNRAPEEVALNAQHVKAPEIPGWVLAAQVHLIWEDIELHNSTISCDWPIHQYQWCLR
jgi:hypothetical protein